MVRDYFLLSLILALPIALGFSSLRPTQPPSIPRKRLYLRGMLKQFAVLTLLLLIDWKAFLKIDFDKVGRGVLSDKENIGNLLSVCMLPLIFSLVPYFKKSYARETDGAIYGFPVNRMPTDYEEFYLFTLLITAGVVFEELFMRQAGFYAFYTTLGWKGDLLLIINSALFAFAHHYKKFGEILGVFFSGLLFGKAYQITGTLAWPILLHFLINCPLLLLAFRRIKKQYI